MTNFIAEAGWPLYPIVAVGFASLAFAVRNAVAPSRERLALAVATLMTTLLVGALGMVIDLELTTRTHGAPGDPMRWLLSQGVAESLNCLLAALLVAGLDALLIVVALLRKPARVPAVAGVTATAR
jgi:hypothetical protein